MIFDRLNQNVYDDFINQYGAQLSPVTDRFNRAWHISNNRKDAVRSIALFIFTFGIYHVHVRRMANKQWRQVLCASANQAPVDRINNERARQDQAGRIAVQDEQIQGLNERIAGLQGVVAERNPRIEADFLALQNQFNAANNEVWERIKSEQQKDATIARLEAALSQKVQTIKDMGEDHQRRIEALEQSKTLDKAGYQQTFANQNKYIQELEKQVQDQLAEIIGLKASHPVDAN
ncbi:MAG: hypothetical protein ACK5MA_07180 [Parachlamydiaceae bacterium]